MGRKLLWPSATPSSARGSSPPLNLGRISGLDGIRAIAVLLVLLAHAGSRGGYTGGTGVSIFFFLSGYLITTLLVREQAATGRISVRNFYVRRVFRIFPPLYLLIAAGCIASALGLTGGRLTAPGIVAAATFGGNYFMVNPHHNWPDGFGILWSLAVEEHFYLVFPLLFVAIQKWSRRNQVMLLSGLCALALAWRFALAAHGYTSHLRLATDARFDAILFGCILALALDPLTPWSLPLQKRVQWPLAIAGALGVLLWEHLPHIKGPLADTLTGLSLIPVFTFILARPTHPVVVLLESPLLVRIGCLSYSIYLFHMLCTSIVGRHTHLSAPLAMILAFPMCSGIALGIERFIDRPAHRWRQRFLRKPTPQAPSIATYEHAVPLTLWTQESFKASHPGCAPPSSNVFGLRASPTHSPPWPLPIPTTSSPPSRQSSASCTAPAPSLPLPARAHSPVEKP